MDTKLRMFLDNKKSGKNISTAFDCVFFIDTEYPMLTAQFGTLYTTSYNLVFVLKS